MMYKKYIIVILMCFPLCIASPDAQSKPRLAQESLIGDVNHDGERDISDVLSIIDYILGKPLSQFDVSMADLNDDESIDISDVLLLVDLILGIESESDLQNPNKDILFPSIE